MQPLATTGVANMNIGDKVEVRGYSFRATALGVPVSEMDYQERVCVVLDISPTLVKVMFCEGIVTDSFYPEDIILLTTGR